jgi:tetratricopeptide (TPR) repeat protein
MKQLLIALVALSCSAYSISAQTNATGTTVATVANSGSREQDGLNGPVRRVRVETANIVTRDGKQVELPKSLIEVSTYDALGRKTDSVAYPVKGASAPGKEEYKYDDKGNIIEMTLRGNDGSLLSKEKYTYEFDEFGNWKKMTAAVAVYENGIVTYEPTEVTYRTLTYYYGPPIPKASVSSASVSERRSDKRNDAKVKPIANNLAPAQPRDVVSDPSSSPASTPTANVGAESNAARVADTEANATKENLKLPVLRITEEVLRKAAIELPQPQYPSGARLGGAAGQVQVELIIDEKGVVNTARATSGNPLLFEAATSAARKARFLMSAFSDKPTNLYGVLTYNFAGSLEGTSTTRSSTSTSNDARVEQSTRTETNSAMSPAPLNERANSNQVLTAATSPSFAAYFNKGIASLASARYEDAIESLTQAVKLNPQDAVAYAKLGLAHSALGAHKPAIAAFKQAIKLNRAFVDPDSYFRLGSAYIAVGDYTSAIDPLNQALYAVKAQQVEGRTPTTGPTETEINGALGRAYYGSGSYRQAARAFETAIRLKPDYASAHYGLGLSYLEIGDKLSAQKEERILRMLNSPLADRLTGMLIQPAGQRNRVF